MNRKIGMWSSVVNAIAVISFAISMLFDFTFGSYFSSMFIAFSFVAMMCGYAYFAEKEAKLSGYVSMTFAAVYTTIILLVYFTQLTTVRLNDLTQQATALLDFQQCGLLFNYDLLGYAVMALATFFAGLTIKQQTKIDKWLKYLLIIHGVFLLLYLYFWTFVVNCFMAVLQSAFLIEKLMASFLNPLCQSNFSACTSDSKEESFSVLYL